MDISRFLHTGYYYYPALDHRKLQVNSKFYNSSGEVNRRVEGREQFEHTCIWNSTNVQQDIVPFGAAAQKDQGLTFQRRSLRDC